MKLIEKIIIKNKYMRDKEILLSSEDKKMLVDMLANPPEANQKLKDAIKRYKKNFNKQ